MHDSSETGKTICACRWHRRESARRDWQDGFRTCASWPSPQRVRYTRTTQTLSHHIWIWCRVCKEMKQKNPGSEEMEWTTSMESKRRKELLLGTKPGEKGRHRWRDSIYAVESSGMVAIAEGQEHNDERRDGRWARTEAWQGADLWDFGIRLTVPTRRYGHRHQSTTARVGRWDPQARHWWGGALTWTNNKVPPTTHASSPVRAIPTKIRPACHTRVLGVQNSGAK
jgi:hypothetical protein